ncbi:alpha-2-macroglobulin-like protein 1 isoform X2 [Hemicordylus capensis]|nr:alpha-2-macroglobulin-like protein 1 isoform X2 [Hemicordylus capensis]
MGKYFIKVGDEVFEMADWTERIDQTVKTFSVEEYDLPTFEVFFELPSLLTTSDEEFQFNVCGKYTYGKPVQGNVYLTLNRQLSYDYVETGNETLTSIEKTYSSQISKNGCVTFIFNGTDVYLDRKEYYNYIQLSAEVEEKGTGVRIEESDQIMIISSDVELTFPELNKFYKHGLPYTGKIKASFNQLPMKNWTVYLTVDVDDKETHFSYVTDENGEVEFTLDTTNWNKTMVSLQARHSIVDETQNNTEAWNTNKAFKWLKPFYSESNSFLEIHHVEDELPCEKDQEVLVDYILDRKELDPAADHVDFYYLVVSRGRIVSSGQKQVPVGQDETLKGTFSLTLSVSADLAPIARLLLYAVFADGEVAADMEVFTVDKCFKHKVTLDFSKEEELPGSKVNLQVEAARGALCSLHAVDKSVTLKSRAHLTPERVYRGHIFAKDTIDGRGFAYHLEDFEPYPCLLPLSQRQKRSLKVAPWYQSESDVYGLFKHLRMKILTNTSVKKPVSCDLPYYERKLFSAIQNKDLLDAPLPNELPNEVPQALDSTENQESLKTKPRTFFPETWIWDLLPMNEEGKANHSVTVPDTITEWKTAAFCVADVGFGLSQQATLRVFKPFFVHLLLPYSVIRGETFQLKATVFNHLKDCIQVRVNMEESQQLEAKPCPTCHFTTCLCEDEAKTFFWNVTATELGHVNLSVTTEAEETHELCGNKISVTPPRGRSDTVVKSLLVKSEGLLEEETQNALLCSTGGPAVEEVSLKLPEAIVKDSGRATISVVGDIMGNALHNLEMLLQLPFGCGEQNMIKFVPNIFILRYLEKTNQATPDIKEKATEYMKSGYQRQLLYKHENGSYSAFGKRDPEGNTWLTAFVVKGFGHAKSYIYVDEKQIQDAVNWLGQHQLPSGCFQNVGRVFNNALKGGVDNEITLTAYVTASLLELYLNHTMIDDALLCLKRNLSSVENAYPAALLAYVFTLAGDMETRKQLLRQLDGWADKTEGALGFSDTETNAYFLLAVLSTPEVSPDDSKYASRIVRALTNEQNPYGGFSSTQETVVALQGLSRYAALTFQEIENIKVLVKSSQGFQHEFHVDRQNRLQQQQASLPDVPGHYKVEVSGRGCTYVQTTLRYNHSPPKTNIFALKVETSPKECNETSQKHFDINLQVSYTGHRQTSNMALIEVNLMSGFIPVKKSVKWLESKPHVKKVELDPGRISIYLDWLDSNVQSYNFSLEQEVEVIDLKPAIVKLYDYYNPDDSETEEYYAPCSPDNTKQDQH